MADAADRLTLKQGIILWISGTLTAFIIMGVFWTVFRNELDAARSLVLRSNATFEKTEQMLDGVNALHRDVSAPDAPDSATR